MTNQRMKTKISSFSNIIIYQRIIFLGDHFLNQIVDCVNSCKCATSTNSPTTVNNKRTAIFLMTLMDSLDKVGQLRNIFYHTIVGPEFEVHVFHNSLFTLKIECNWIQQFYNIYRNTPDSPVSSSSRTVSPSSIFFVDMFVIFKSP